MNVICTAIGGYIGITCQPEQASIEVIREQYLNHVAKYGLSFGTKEEHEFRFEQYLRIDKEINSINAEQTSFWAGHNKFSTLTKDEYRRMLGKKKPVYTQEKEVYLDTQNLSESVDWRAKGAVNAVQDQGQCGSCWAFSSTAAMEGAHFLKTGSLLKLSEQQLVDCDPQSSGCNGGLEAYAFEYLEKSAQELESAYPYTARNGVCKYAKAKGQVDAITYASVPKRSVAQLKAAIDVQPTCVSVEADTAVFQSYTGGILDSTRCGTNLDHAITAVGYGTENGVDYAIVRNSWGPDWGENGYIRIAITKNDSGVCGILLDSTRPTTD